MKQELSTNPNYYLPIINGYSRLGGAASDAVRLDVFTTIIEQAKLAGLGNQDTANLLAIATKESNFNPDAANFVSSASGVFGIINRTAEDAAARLNGNRLIGGYKFPSTYKPFDPLTNIQYGIAIYLDKKRASGGSTDLAKIYQRYNPNELGEWYGMPRGS